MRELSSVLYPSSPFLPTITPALAQLLFHEMLVNRRPSSVAISITLTNVAADLCDYFVNDMAWLCDTFNTDGKGIDSFIFGYTIPSSLIIGSFIMDNYGVEEAFKRTCPPATNEHLLEVNMYKSEHLINCALIYHSLRADQKRAGLEIIKYCQDRPFSCEFFFQVGIESFKSNYLYLYQCLDTLQ